MTPVPKIGMDAALALVREELLAAITRFDPFHGPHEGYAVILEELDELWAEIKDDKQPSADRHAAMRNEAIQVAAMALRFVVDVHTTPVRQARHAPPTANDKEGQPCPPHS